MRSKPALLGSLASEDNRALSQRFHWTITSKRLVYKLLPSAYSEPLILHRSLGHFHALIVSRVRDVEADSR